MGAEVVRSGGLTGYRRLLRSLGADPDTLLAELGIRAEAMDDPDRYISYPAVIAAIEAPAGRLGISDFGLRLAAYQDISIIGPLAFAMQNATSAYQGMKLAAGNIAFQSPAIRLDLQEDPDPGFDRLRFGIALSHPQRMAQAIEHAVGMLNHALQLISAGMLSVTSVHFQHDRVSRLKPIASISAPIRSLGKAGTASASRAAPFAAGCRSAAGLWPNMPANSPPCGHPLGTCPPTGACWRCCAT